jgi:hypothetical protein
MGVKLMAGIVWMEVYRRNQRRARLAKLAAGIVLVVYVALLVCVWIWGRPGVFVSSLVCVVLGGLAGRPLGRWWLANPTIGRTILTILLGLFIALGGSASMLLLRYLQWIPVLPPFP